jgi:hypothetical protein
MRTSFVTTQGSPYMRFRRARDRGNVTEALSAAAELQFVGLVEALELTLLLADEVLQRYERAAVPWHARFLHETKNVDLRESLGVLGLLARSRRIAWPLPPSPSSSPGDDPASKSPRLLSAGRGRRRPCHKVAPRQPPERCRGATSQRAFSGLACRRSRPRRRARTSRNSSLPSWWNVQ